MSIAPDGYITREEAAAAKDIANDLLNNYGVVAEEDWGDHIVWHFQWVWPPFSSYVEWKTGRWTLVELQTVAEALSDLAALMGGAAQLRAFVGTTKVKMAASACGRGCTPYCGRYVKFLDAGRPPAKVDVQNDRNIDKWTVVHEFGHAWDRNNRWRLSAELEQYTKGHTSKLERLTLKNPDADKRLPGCNNAGYFYGGCPPKGSNAGFTRKEDFAESVAASVYPVEAQNVIAHYAGHPVYGNLYYSDFKLTDRWRYVQAVINRDIAV